MIEYRDPRDFLILNVDDTEAIRYAKSRTLHRAGYQVVECGTGAEALRLVETRAPALALLDVKLPDMSGIDVCRRIKRDYPGTLVLQISATFISSNDRVRGLESGADAYLAQPVTADELTASIAALLRTRRIEDELREVNEKLELRVAASSEALQAEIEQRELVEAALRQSQKMEAIGHLTGGIAHDFNNLLMAVLGNLDMIERRHSQGRADIDGYLNNAVEAAKRAAALTQRLLTFARRQPLEAVRIDPADLFRGVEPIVRTTLGAGVRVLFDCPQDIWDVACDRHQLENAILNLAINARDAMPNGGELKIAARNCVLDAEQAAALPQGSPGEFVRISVTDSGAGMPPEIAAQAFDPFFTTKPQGQGTGLGLSMLYSFVQQSRGSVDLKSRIGRGTEVAMLLPRADEAAEAAALAEGRAPVMRGDGETVLLVEDEDLVRDLLLEGLLERGYRCLEAGTAQQALDIAASGVPFDVLMTDVGLPGRMNGRELAETIAASRPGMRTVLISGHAGDPLADAIAAPANFAYLAKPFDMDKLGATLRGVLEAPAA